MTLKYFEPLSLFFQLGSGLHIQGSEHSHSDHKIEHISQASEQF